MSRRPRSQSLAKIEVPCAGGFVHEIGFWVVVSVIASTCIFVIANWQFVAFEVALLAVVVLVSVGAGFVRAILWGAGPRRFFLGILSRFASRSYVEVFRGEAGAVCVYFSFDVLRLRLVELEVRGSEIAGLRCKPSQEMARGHSGDSWQVVLWFDKLPRVEPKSSAVCRNDFHMVGPAQSRHEAQQLACRIATLLQSTGVDIEVGD